MKGDSKLSWSLTGITLMLLGLAAAFILDLWGRPTAPQSWPAVDPQFTNTAPIRLSAAEVIRTGEDASGFDCYACHEKSKPTVIHYDDQKNIVLPKEHADLVMAHGRHNRNESCFNCHDSENLDMLKTRSGESFKLTDSTPLCASCHGPTWRDWKLGIHGRDTGYWDASLGPRARLECASCHNPHAPAFDQVAPAPRPRHLYETENTPKEHH
jgi:formate-dependent nitrite reductase cytochrome c552 subunit